MKPFDWEQYIANYPDLQNAGINSHDLALGHYTRFGIAENRTDKLEIPYNIKGYHDLLIEHKDHQQLKELKELKDSKIPKIIFKTSPYKRESMNYEIIQVLENLKKLNPDYQIYYFDDNEMEESIKDISSKYHEVFLKLIPSAYRADFWRYCILEKYGGCYSDIGHSFLVPFDEITTNDLVLVKDISNIGIHNALVCCTQGHPFLKKAIERCIFNIDLKSYGCNPFDITGPTMLQKIHNGEPIDLRLTEEGTIVTSSGKVILKTKFDNYYSILYKHKTLHYPYLWNNRKIYN